MKITLEEAIRLVRGKIAGCSKYNESQIVDTIHLAQTRAWNSGKWYNMTHRLLVRVIEGRVVLPAEYGVMEGINLQGVPRMVHSNWYEFSPSGPGSNSNRCHWHRGIFDLQDVPTVWVIHKGERVVAVSESKNGEDMNLEVNIQGINSDGNPIYRYYSEVNGTERTNLSDAGEKIRVSARMDNGELSPATWTYNAFAHNGITAITKPQTRGPIDIYAVMTGNYGRKLVTLQPNQTQSTLRAYRVPEGCQCGECVEVMARKAEPERPRHPSEILQIENIDALIALCMSVYYDYSTMEPEKGMLYFNKGLAYLNGQLQEQSGNEIVRPNVWTPVSLARNNRRQSPVY